jgi:deoxycytidylate deaminase
MNQKETDLYFIQRAEEAKSLSRDRSTHVGAVLVDCLGNIISEAGNRFPEECGEEESWHERPMKYMVTVHAERYAICTAARMGRRTEGSSIYISGYGTPCSICAQDIICAGVKECVVKYGPFTGKGTHWGEECRIGRMLLERAGILVFLDEDCNRMVNVPEWK